MRMNVLLAAILLSGCASQHIEIEPTDRYSQLDRINAIETHSIELPGVPRLEVRTLDNQVVAVLDKDGVDRLQEFRDAANQNNEALALLLSAHNDLIIQRNLMLENMRLEESRANFYAQQFVIAENMRRDQHDEFKTELWIHKVLIVILSLGLAL